jgi:hypothetical protein
VGEPEQLQGRVDHEGRPAQPTVFAQLIEMDSVDHETR